VPLHVAQPILAAATAAEVGTWVRSLGDWDAVARPHICMLKLLHMCPQTPAAVWKEVQDPGSGDIYYWNVQTGETSW